MDNSDCCEMGNDRFEMHRRSTPQLKMGRESCDSDRLGRPNSDHLEGLPTKRVLPSDCPTSDDHVQTQTK
jgi:hypothetical protein